MPRRKDKPSRGQRLDWAIEAAEQVMTYTAGLDHQAFQASRLHQDAITLQLFQIAENLKPLDDPDGTFREIFPMLGEIIGMRNYIAHEYRSVDMDTIWNAATRFVPLLRDQLQDARDQQ